MLFDKYHERPFTFVEPGGNFGDELIYKGARKLAAAAGLTYTTLAYADFMESTVAPEAVIYIHGSGGCTPLYSCTPVAALHKAWETHPGVVVLGPSTVWDNRHFMRYMFRQRQPSQSERIVVFARELVSFSLMKAAAGAHIDVHVDHDTALNLDHSDCDVTSPFRNVALLALRSDEERPRHTKYPEHAIDPVHACCRLQDWLALHAGCSKIITNRLHSAIVGLLLHKRVTLLPNSYFKNRAVWEYSLRKAGVSWAATLSRIDLDGRNLL